MSSNRSVLIISPFFKPNIGGVETVLTNLIKANKKSGYHSIVVTYQPLTVRARGLRYEKGDGFEVYRLNWFGLGWFNVLENYFPLVFLYLFPGLFIKSLIIYLKRHSEIVCINPHGFIAGCITRIITLFKRKRVVANTHAIYRLQERKILAFFINLIYRKFENIVPVSEIALEEFSYLGISKKRLKCFKNWVDTDILKPRNYTDSAKKLGIETDKNFLFVGRFIEKKGILVFLKAAKGNSDINFHIVGSGDLEGVVKKASEDCKNIFYHGKLMQSINEEFDKLINLYSVCNFFVSPYLYEEGFSTTLLESLSCGTPVVVSNRGSPPTFLNNDVAFYLSKNPTGKELGDMLQSLFSKNIDIEEKCRNFAVENFGFKNADIIISSYE